MTRALLALALLLAPLAARAQVESREGIILQNQILQLRQELELTRRGALPPAALPPPGRGAVPAPGAGGELVGPLLSRIGALEEEVRRLRGRAEEAEFRARTLQQELEKLREDSEFRFQRVEERGAAPAQPRQGAAPAPAAGPGPATPAQPATAPRTPERALQEGQAALGRRDWPAAEAAAREVLGSRNAPRQQDAALLLADSLLGRRDFQAAALAYDDALRRGPRTGRAGEARFGLAESFLGLGARREACETLEPLRAAQANLPAPQARRLTDLRGRAGCR